MITVQLTLSRQCASLHLFDHVARQDIKATNSMGARMNNMQWNQKATWPLLNPSEHKGSYLRPGCHLDASHSGDSPMDIICMGSETDSRHYNSNATTGSENWI
jgi:hypothetical protein